MPTFVLPLKSRDEHEVSVVEREELLFRERLMLELELELELELDGEKVEDEPSKAAQELFLLKFMFKEEE